MFYSWATKTKDFPTQDGRNVALRYKYLGLMFIFTVVVSKKYFVYGNDRNADQEINKEQATQLIGSPPALSFWRSYSLPLAIGLIIFSAVISSAFQSIT